MSDVGERLRTLQRQIGRTGNTNAATSTVRSDLRRLIDFRRRATTRKLAAPGGIEVAEGLHLVEWRRPSEASRSVELPWGDAGEVERERLVCFDTETTGLAGGVGTRAFMIGSARWRDGELVVRQLYLTALGGEAEMLRRFSCGLPADAIFVSYNGRSYDAPLLKGRYRLHRQGHPFDNRGHVDLLHPVRRAYRGVWENCRLQTIERQLLGIVREDDLPGHEAPAAWLAYLRGQSSTALGRVLDHNRQDVVTLAILFDRLAAAIRPLRP